MSCVSQGGSLAARRTKVQVSDVPDTAPSAETLSRWLEDCGTIPRGAVAELHIDRRFRTTVSDLVFFSVTYTADAPTDLPRNLVVKSPLHPPTVPDAAVRELEFYRRLGPELGTPPLVRYLTAIEAGDAERGTLILEDIRATHDHLPWPLPPSSAQCELAIDALARVHATWWEAPALGKTVGRLHTAESLRAMVGGIVAYLPGFIAAFGDVIPDATRRVYERVFASSLKPWLRLTDTVALTVAHGDAHAWNFLFPRSGRGPAVLIDWQLWHLDVGARDLAYFMALHWYPGRRRELEVPLLRSYHERLLALGIERYPFDALWLDYRRGVVRNLTIPLLLWSRGMAPEAWWHRLECAVAAYHELECEELL